jgi:hypothetical protein
MKTTRLITTIAVALTLLALTATGAQAQDLRMPDTRDAAAAQTQDLRMPDTRDAASPFDTRLFPPAVNPSDAPVPPPAAAPVEITSSHTDWTMIALATGGFLLAVAAFALVTARGRRRVAA